MADTAFRVISIDSIDDPARPLRSDLSPESVEDLVISIRQVGIIEPLVVKPKNGRWEVIAGHRRLVAAGIADLVEVPCYIVNVDDERAEFLKLHENLYRANIAPSDQAEHFHYLIQHFKLSIAKIAALIAKSEAYVIDRLNILNYPPELKEALDKGDIKFSVSREFYRLKDRDKLTEYLGYAIARGVSPAMAKRWIDDTLRQQQPQSQQTATDFPGDLNPQPIEQHTTCVKCAQPVKLAEAVISYFHDACYKEVAPN